MKNFIFSTIICGMLLGLADGCPQNGTNPGPTPIVTDTDMCDDADLHLAQLCAADSKKNAYCCQVDAKTLKGKSYTQFCTEKQNQGVSLNPGCVAKITSCDQIDACTNSK